MAHHVKSDIRRLLVSVLLEGNTDQAARAVAARSALAALSRRHTVPTTVRVVALEGIFAVLSRSNRMLSVFCRNVVALCLALTIVGCGDDAPSPDGAVADVVREAAPRDSTAESAIDSQADVASCSIDGKWRAKDAAGIEFFYTFTLAANSVLFEVPMFGFVHTGTFSFDGARLKWSTDRPDCTTVEGEYTIAFASDCKTFVPTLVDDACTKRYIGIPGLPFTRQ